LREKKNEAKHAHTDLQEECAHKGDRYVKLTTTTILTTSIQREREREKEDTPHTHTHDREKSRLR